MDEVINFFSEYWKGILASFIAACLFSAFLYFLPGLRHFCFKYLLFPFWTYKRIADLNKRTGTLEENAAAFRENLSKLKIQPSPETKPESDKTPQYETEEFLGMVWKYSVGQDIGPYCLECKNSKSRNPLLPLQITDLTTQIDVYCPSHSNHVRILSREEYQSAKAKFTAPS